MTKGNNKLHEFKQERRIIDSVEWWVYELHDEFLEKIKWQFSEEELEKFSKTFLNLKYLNHVPKDIVDAFKQGRHSSLDGDTLTIEVTIQDQLVGLLYERRTDLNHAEVTYFIFKDKLQKLKKEIIKKCK